MTDMAKVIFVVLFTSMACFSICFAIWWMSPQQVLKRERECFEEGYSYAWDTLNEALIEGEDVRKIMEELVKESFTPNDSFSSGIRSAVMAFEKANGIQ